MRAYLVICNTYLLDQQRTLIRVFAFNAGWLEANVAFIQSGGFNMSEARIRQVSRCRIVICYHDDTCVCNSVILVHMQHLHRLCASSDLKLEKKAKTLESNGQLA